MKILPWHHAWVRGEGRISYVSAVAAKAGRSVACLLEAWPKRASGFRGRSKWYVTPLSLPPPFGQRLGLSCIHIVRQKYQGIVWFDDKFDTSTRPRVIHVVPVGSFF